MAYQYLYPSGDLVVNNWLNTDSGLPLYPYVDEGVSSANDNDFMYLVDGAPTTSGDNFYILSGEFKFDMGELICHPVLDSGGITVNMRAKAPLGDWKFGDMYFHDNSGTVIARHTGLVNVPSGNVYADYEAKFENYPWLGSWGNYDLDNTTLLVNVAIPSGQTTIDSYISAVEVVASGWLTGTNNNVDLYVPGQIDYDDITLYLNVWNPDSGNTTLWIGGAFTQNTIPLYIRGLFSGESDADLYVGGHVTVDDNTTLYIRGFDVESGSLSLYILPYGDEATDDITLHTQAGIVGINGGASPNYITLYMEVEPTNEELPLYITAPLSDDITTNMPLFIKRAYEWDGGNIPLYINNTLIWSGIPLFMQAPSGTDGAIPRSGEMYLYIARDSEAIDYHAPLYVSGPEAVNDDAELYIEGGPSLHDTITLVIPSTEEVDSGFIPLYTHGF